MLTYSSNEKISWTIECIDFDIFVLFIILWPMKMGSSCMREQVIHLFNVVPAFVVVPRYIKSILSSC